MIEQEILDRAYEGTIQQLYTVFYNELLLAQNSAQREDAEHRFQAGVRRARQIRARAEELLSQ